MVEQCKLFIGFVSQLGNRGTFLRSCGTCGWYKVQERHADEVEKFPQSV